MEDNCCPVLKILTGTKPTHKLNTYIKKHTHTHTHTKRQTYTNTHKAHSHIHTTLTPKNKKPSHILKNYPSPSYALTHTHTHTHTKIYTYTNINTNINTNIRNRKCLTSKHLIPFYIIWSNSGGYNKTNIRHSYICFKTNFNCMQNNIQSP